MAEAVELPTPTKYFCHQCSREVSPLHPFVELICPECSSGFIEEVSRDLYEAQEEYIAEQEDEFNPAADWDHHIADELMLQNAFQVQGILNRALNNIGVDEDEDSEASYAEHLFSINELENYFNYRAFEMTRDGSRKENLHMKGETKPL
ncbi:uncharacterized protein LOC129227984 [Uloborus diversus]|uniref:uncharacterized protein LOC129227984 n=1 Tax=Uloborus diversus TaxID=327109 RepID=UPI00240973F7|nr:uncharacterized protein LOC129227984 [Uloborus diversus]